MTIWQRIWQWLACRDPDDIDSGFPDGTQPIPQGMPVPGENTQKMMVQQFPPIDWDALEERLNDRWQHKDTT